MVDILQVLEGAAYVGFIAGAIFAVLELRTMSRDRRTELSLRMTEYMCSREFEEATAIFMKAKFKTAQEAEEQCSLAVLLMVADYCESIGYMARKKLVPMDIILETIPIEYCWDKIKIWAHDDESADPARANYGAAYQSFEWLANEDRKRRQAEEQKAKGV